MICSKSQMVEQSFWVINQKNHTESDMDPV